MSTETSRPLSPAAREAVEWIAGRLQESTSSYNLGTFIEIGLPAASVVPAEPVSVLPEGDGTGEGPSEALRAAWDTLRKQRDNARGDRDRLREEVTQLRAGADTEVLPDGAEPTPGQFWNYLLALDVGIRMAVLGTFLDYEEIASECFKLDHERLTADLTQLRAENERLRGLLRARLGEPFAGVAKCSLCGQIGGQP